MVAAMCGRGIGCRRADSTTTLLIWDLLFFSCNHPMAYTDYHRPVGFRLLFNAHSSASSSQQGPSFFACNFSMIQTSKNPRNSLLPHCPPSSSNKRLTTFVSDQFPATFWRKKSSLQAKRPSVCIDKGLNFLQWCIKLPLTWFPSPPSHYPFPSSPLEFLPQQLDFIFSL